MRVKLRRFLIFVCAASAFTMLSCGVFLSYRLLKTHPVESILNIVQRDDLEYLVHQKENPYISRPSLGMGENYLLSYTDRIELRNAYSFAMSDTVETQYDYVVTANLISRYARSTGGGTNPEVMRKTYLIDEDRQTMISDGTQIDRTYDIYLDGYIRELDEFAQTVDIPVTGELRIDMTVSLHSPEEFSDSFVRGITVPLDSEFYNITTHGEGRVETNHSILERSLPVWGVIALALLIVACGGVFFTALKKLLDRRSPFYREVDGYLKAYDDIIVSTATPLDFEQYKIVTVKNFKEMLNMSNKTGHPIIYWEDGGNAHFYLLSQNLLFMFTVSRHAHGPAPANA